MLEQIGIDRQIKKDIIKGILSETFKGCKIHYFDQGNTWGIEDEEQLDDDAICFSLIRNESEFPIMIEITRTPDKNTTERGQYLAKIISDKLNCKTITDYKELYESLYDPSDSIIFENGYAYLVDDSNTMWADGEGGKVKIVKEIVFVNYKFDDKANLINDNS
ncbi:hypothetical protein [Chryseobacterium vrystaatense]|uniref:Uncharacterized protein n=1 Tax=Chryseobacterium vrystaatense TaxID=307480 RepID=A0ABR4UFC0_9FLAO|nr:hypothetical protein [Chryseobacterium vrystaatense]KFF22657.1 hypothetical protein IW16_26625 [Chryseobacterium vrystaatense]